MALVGLLLLGIVGVFALSMLLAVVGAVFHALVWVVLLPFRLIGALVAGLFGILTFGILGIVGVVLATALGLVFLAPVLPLLIVGGLIWMVLRALRRPAIA